MIHFNNLQSLFLSDKLNQSKTYQLKVGDVVNGQILKLLPDELALVQIGGTKLQAKVNVPLESNVHYWFQVVQNESMLELKVMNEFPEGKINSAQEQQNISLLIKKFGLADTKENHQLVRMLVQHQLPITKESLFSASQWLAGIEKAEFPKAMEAIRLAIQKELPLSKNVLSSLLAVQSEEPITEQLGRVLDAIKVGNQKSAPIQELQALLNKLTNQSLEIASNANPKPEMLKQAGFIEQPSSQLDKWLVSDMDRTTKQPVLAELLNGNDIQKTIKQIIRQFGFQFEQDISILQKEQSSEKLSTLKPLLLRALQESLTPAARENVEQLLQRITGQQLMNTEQSSSVQQLLLQIPFIYGNHSTDVIIQWSGKKQKNGQIDPDFCRIVFYLELEHLQEVLVDVHVQNRVVSIQIYNDNPELYTIVKKYQAVLKNQLGSLHYRLLSINVTSSEEIVTDKKQSITLTTLPFTTDMSNGVDIKI